MLSSPGSNEYDFVILNNERLRPFWRRVYSVNSSAKHFVLSVHLLGRFHLYQQHACWTHGLWKCSSSSSLRSMLLVVQSDREEKRKKRKTVAPIAPPADLHVISSSQILFAKSNSVCFRNDSIVKKHVGGLPTESVESVKYLLKVLDMLHEWHDVFRGVCCF